MMDDIRPPLLKNQYLLCVIVFVRRDDLFRRQGLGENKKILCVAKLAVELDEKWHAAQRPQTVHKMIAIVFLHNHRLGRRAIRALCGRPILGMNKIDTTRRRTSESNE